MTGHTIAVTTHGRYLHEPSGSDPVGLLVGFHGQGETAAIELEHLQIIRGDRAWALVSVQGLHRYYTRRGDVVAAWMTREDRELAIADNIAYVRAVLDEVKATMAKAPMPVVCCGFSQGTAMAYRTAAFSGHRIDGLIILAGNLPPTCNPSHRHCRRSCSGEARPRSGIPRKGPPSMSHVSAMPASKQSSRCSMMGMCATRRSSPAPERSSTRSQEPRA